ncbi:MAG: NAD(P)-dependent oxidoreductase [Dysgonamonadaceae bacterium]|jgi:nucleoside-diphosphate-sugar epimerase|nr:NAD(P)-dependent oxidoreductase [Dysgonamonadaceae bacterium]
MRILITGASGFIGSFMVEEAIKRGFETYAGIRQTSSRKYLQDKRIQFADLNFADTTILAEQLRVLGRFDYIIHNAGVTKCQNKGDFDRVNFGYTRNFVDALTEAGLMPDKFLYMSSLSAYGSGNEKTLQPMMLADTPRPNTAYGESKLKAERYIQSLNNAPYIILRPTGVYGPRETDYFVFNQTINRGIEPSMGFGTQYLTFIYVKDLVRVAFDALESNIVRKAYFVSDGKVYTNVEYTEIVKNILGIKRMLKLKTPLFLAKFIAVLLETVYGWFGKTPTLNRDKYNILSAKNWKCEIEPLERDFNSHAEYDLERGMTEAIEWYKKEKWLK